MCEGFTVQSYAKIKLGANWKSKQSEPFIYSDFVISFRIKARIFLCQTRFPYKIFAVFTNNPKNIL
jgi:hypothetical protein